MLSPTYLVKGEFFLPDASKLTSSASVEEESFTQIVIAHIENNNKQHRQTEQNPPDPGKSHVEEDDPIYDIPTNTTYHKFETVVELHPPHVTADPNKPVHHSGKEGVLEGKETAPNGNAVQAE